MNQLLPIGVTAEKGINCTLSPVFERERIIFPSVAPFALSPVVAKKMRKALDIRNSGMRADHVGLAHEDENAQSLGVRIRAVGGEEENLFHSGCN